MNTVIVYRHNYDSRENKDWAWKNKGKIGKKILIGTPWS